ncbi:hypothetical protein K3728_06680 [Rhodobacteraceae bacterium M385]|nr:hypothetical protein K3728_06680 [Rhodobacteraceae bacterium M385]
MTERFSAPASSGKSQTNHAAPQQNRVHPVATEQSSPFVERTARSVAIAKTMARMLGVDLFDEHRRGRFKELVQNCDVCFLHKDCYQQVEERTPIRAVPTHCRNRHDFAPAKALRSATR